MFIIIIIEYLQLFSLNYLYIVINSLESHGSSSISLQPLAKPQAWFPCAAWWIFVLTRSAVFRAPMRRPLKLFPPKNDDFDKVEMMINHCNHCSMRFSCILFLNNSLWFETDVRSVYIERFVFYVPWLQQHTMNRQLPSRYGSVFLFWVTINVIHMLASFPAIKPPDAEWVSGQHLLIPSSWSAAVDQAQHSLFQLLITFERCGLQQAHGHLTIFRASSICSACSLGVWQAKNSSYSNSS